MLVSKDTHSVFILNVNTHLFNIHSYSCVCVRRYACCTAGPHICFFGKQWEFQVSFNPVGERAEREDEDGKCFFVDIIEIYNIILIQWMELQKEKLNNNNNNNIHSFLFLWTNLKYTKERKEK